MGPVTAERRLAAAVADIGVATADLYPRFFLTGVAGFESVSFPDLFDSESGFFSIGPSIHWPLFRGGELRARVDAAEARSDGAYAAFQQTVLVAVEDVERSLVRYAQRELERRELEESVSASRRAVELAEVQYSTGLVDFLTVLDSERRLRDVEDRLAIVETGVSTDAIAVFKALGGGWEAEGTERVGEALAGLQ